MSRPAIMGVELMDNVEFIGVVDLGAWQDPVCAIDLEDRHRDHERAGEREGVILGEI